MEALDKEREPLPHLDAVYIMLPTKEVRALVPKELLALRLPLFVKSNCDYCEVVFTVGES